MHREVEASGGLREGSSIPSAGVGHATTEPAPAATTQAPAFSEPSDNSPCLVNGAPPALGDIDKDSEKKAAERFWHELGSSSSGGIQYTWPLFESL
ncbi:hypothetical protein MTO96_010902 [Rhipicephalus appendiculatus]